MKMADNMYIVACGKNGFGISNDADCHVYLIENDSEHIMIDAGVGMEVDRIVDNIRNDGLNPEDIGHIFLTHVHSDHAGGSAEFQSRFGCKIYAPKAEAHLMRSADEEGLGLILAKADNIYPQEYVFPKCEPDVEVTDGNIFTIGNLTIKAIHTPGHSEGSTCYLTEVNGKTCLFSGDVALAKGLILFLNCPGTTMKKYRESIPKLANLGIEMLFPGHGCFILSGGQEHLDIAIDNLSHLVPPPNGI